MEKNQVPQPVDQIEVAESELSEAELEETSGGMTYDNNAPVAVFRGNFSPAAVFRGNFSPEAVFRDNTTQK